MTDQTAHDVTDYDRRLAREWAEAIESTTNSVESTTNPWSDRALAAARVLLAVLPPRPTLADMTPSKRAACQWMQCDVRGFQGQLVLATTYDDDDEAGLISECGEVVWSSPGHVTPRPDLPRMTWPAAQYPNPNEEGGTND